jgi:hypothetical protein
LLWTACFFQFCLFAYEFVFLNYEALRPYSDLNNERLDSKAKNTILMVVLETNLTSSQWFQTMEIISLLIYLYLYILLFFVQVDQLASTSVDWDGRVSCSDALDHGLVS